MYQSKYQLLQVPWLDDGQVPQGEVRLGAATANHRTRGTWQYGTTWTGQPSAVVDMLSFEACNTARGETGLWFHQGQDHQSSFHCLQVMEQQVSFQFINRHKSTSYQSSKARYLARPWKPRSGGGLHFRWESQRWTSQRSPRGALDWWTFAPRDSSESHSPIWLWCSSCTSSAMDCATFGVCSA